MTPAPDPLAELETLMVQVLTETRAAVRQVEDLRAEFRAAAARQRGIQRMALSAGVLLLPLLGYFLYRSLTV
jgi:hypothetical protein